MKETAPVLRETPACLCLASRRAARAITRAFDQALRGHGLKATQFTLLATLALKGEQTISALARFIVAEKSTMLRNVAAAEREGLVSVREDPNDARVRRVAITQEGRRRLNDSLASWRAVQAKLTGQLGPGGADALRALAAEMSTTSG